MQVETFECSEVSAEPVDATAEAITLIESLGLEGQQALVCPTKSEGQNARFPFREMLADEVFVYERLCPKKTEIQSYRASAIPLRVLQIAGMAKALMPDCHLYVWDREEAMIPDPVLVAQNEKEGYTFRSGTKRWILARWGTELETFQTLFTRAITGHKADLIAKCDELKGLIQNASPATVVKRGGLNLWACHI